MAETLALAGLGEGLQEWPAAAAPFQDRPAGREMFADEMQNQHRELGLLADPGGRGAARPGSHACQHQADGAYASDHSRGLGNRRHRPREQQSRRIAWRAPG